MSKKRSESTAALKAWMHVHMFVCTDVRDLFT